MALSEGLPKTFQKLVVAKKSIDFREAASVVTASKPALKPNEILVQNKYVGINASDIIRASGKYYNEDLPFDIGLEGVGKVVAVGNGVTKFKKDEYVLYIRSGAYSEYIVFTEDEQTDLQILPPVVIKEPKPEYIPLAGVSGLTAKVALEKCAELKTGETVLVTAAAGGTGHLAVIFAKDKNCHVIGTCSTKEKASFLKSIGCDRVVITKDEKLEDVLTSEYPKGVDVVFESVGGEFFKAALSNLATGGRLLVIGYIKGYKSESVPYSDLQSLPQTLLAKSASVRGFYLFHYFQYLREVMKELTVEFENKLDRFYVDNGKRIGKEFSGIGSVIDAVEYLHSAKSYGKVFVTL